MKGRYKHGLCQHCQRRAINRPRQLCWTCYNDARIVARYPSKQKYNSFSMEAQERKPPHRPGEPLYRCVWCNQFRCHYPLSRCQKCWAIYDYLVARERARGRNMAFETGYPARVRGARPQRREVG